jgi:hypothetical protein
VKLVQMPTDLLHLEDADLDQAGIEPRLLAAFRAYLPRALDERRGLAILAPPEAGAHRLLMVLARRVGAALRDANIRLRDTGGDLKSGRQRLCYLPGDALGAALARSGARAELAGEAACFLQDLDAAWQANATPPEPAALLGLLDERLAAGRPTFLNTAPERLPPGLADGLRARLLALEPAP